jgi:ribosome maturation factor RimP
MDIGNRVKELIEKVVTEQGYILDQVEYVKEGSMYFLRVIIDKQGFIDLDDCVKVTELINPIVDKCDFLTDNYTLDVCSKEKGWE